MKKRIMTKKQNKTFLLKSCGVVFVIFLLVSAISSVYTRSEYLKIHIDVVKKNTEILNRYVVESLTDYAAFPWLIDRWTTNRKTTGRFVSAEQATGWVDQSDLTRITADQIEAREECDKDAFTYICYSRIATGFDQTYVAFRPKAIFCVATVDGVPLCLFCGDEYSNDREHSPNLHEAADQIDQSALDEIYSSLSPDCVTRRGDLDGTGGEHMAFYTPILENGRVLCVIVCVKDLGEVVEDINESALKIAVVNVLMLFALTLLVMAFLFRRQKEKLDLAAQREKTQAEMEIAAKIQADQMPDPARELTSQKEFDVAGFIKPAKEVGGDFFDCFMIDGAHIALAVADVSDKGIPAALFMMLTKTLIKNELLQGHSPAEALNAVNRQLTEQNAEGMFVTVWLAVVDLLTGECDVVNAGHEDPLVRKSDGEWEFLQYHHHLALGITPKTVYQGHRRILNKGDSVFVFTDGVTEEMNAARERYGNDRLRDVLNSCAGADAASLVRAVKDDVTAFFADVEQFDDITMLCFRYFGSDSFTAAARNDSLGAVNEFILSRAERFGASKQERNEIRLSVEEIFGNIVDYAYEDADGVVEIDIDTDDPRGMFSVTFRDAGAPFDPTAVGAPKLTSDTGQRQVGGLGIYLAKQMTDEIVYEYRDGKNVLTMRKRIAQTRS